MSCPACEQSRREGKNFCAQCGAPLMSEAPSQWKADMPPRPDAAPAVPAAPEPPAPAKKPRKRALAVVAALAAVIVAAVVLLVTGVFSPDKPKEKGSDGPVYEKPVTAKTSDASEDADGTYTIMERGMGRVVYTGAEETEDAYRFLFEIENMTNDPIEIIIRSEAVNGRQFDCSVGKSENELSGDTSRNVSISLSKEALETFKIRSLDQIEAFMVAVWVDVDGETEEFALAEFAPDGSDPGEYSPPERMAFSKELLVVNEPDVKFLIGQPQVNANGDLVVLIYYKNQRDHLVEVDLDSFVSSGKSLDGVSQTRMISETEGYNWFIIPADSLQSAGINPSKIRKLTFRVAAADDGADAPFLDQTVEYTISKY